MENIFFYINFYLNFICRYFVPGEQSWPICDGAEITTATDCT